MPLLTNDEFIKRISDKHPNIIVKNEYIGAKQQIECQCADCEYIWSTRAENLYRCGCPCCGGLKVKQGINDLWTTNPILAGMLLNPEDGYKYSQSSTKKLDWICRSCGTIIRNKSVYNVYKNGLSCPICSDGMSYPEKFFANILNQLDIKYEQHISFKWSQSKMYDFYLVEYNIICEIMGRQHYEPNFNFSFSDDCLNKEQENDIFKEKLAKSNGINDYIKINAKNAEFSWIKRYIIKSEFANHFNLDNIDWELCQKSSLKSIITEVCEYYNNHDVLIKDICEKFHTTKGTVRKYLITGAEIGICNYTIKEQRQKANKIIKKSLEKKIICITTGDIFDSIREAEFKYNISGISRCLSNLNNHCGKTSDGTPLTWMIYDDYLIYKKNNNGKEPCYHEPYSNKKLIIQCDLLGNYISIYNSILEASSIIQIDNSSISKVCRHKQKSAGGYIWRYATPEEIILHEGRVKNN